MSGVLSPSLREAPGRGSDRSFSLVVSLRILAGQDLSQLGLEVTQIPRLVSAGFQALRVQRGLSSPSPIPCPRQPSYTAGPQAAPLLP